MGEQAALYSFRTVCGKKDLDGTIRVYFYQKERKSDNSGSESCTLVCPDDGFDIAVCA